VAELEYSCRRHRYTDTAFEDGIDAPMPENIYVDRLTRNIPEAKAMLKAVK
jgi:hypothetical protein